MSALGQTFEMYGVMLHPGVREQTVCCPVHRESRPSCRVNVDKGAFFCHGCEAKGGYLQLIMAMEGCDFERARELAAAAGIRSEDDGARNGEVSGRYQRRGAMAGGAGDTYGNRRYIPARRG